MVGDLRGTSEMEGGDLTGKLRVTGVGRQAFQAESEVQPQVWPGGSVTELRITRSLILGRAASWTSPGEARRAIRLLAQHRAMTESKMLYVRPGCGGSTRSGRGHSSYRKDCASRGVPLWLEKWATAREDCGAGGCWASGRVWRRRSGNSRMERDVEASRVCRHLRAESVSIGRAVPGALSAGYERTGQRRAVVPCNVGALACLLAVRYAPAWGRSGGMRPGLNLLRACCVVSVQGWALFVWMRA